MNRVELIRSEEKKYHDFCYEQYKLFEAGSWLHKPVRSVLDILEQFEGYEDLQVLDLGSGIGRNSIPIAEAMKHRSGKVMCVDLLESAIEKLRINSEAYGVQAFIETRLSDIEHFEIEQSHYDMIIAVSTLEHLSSEDALARKLHEMRLGTAQNGVNIIIIGSNISEVGVGTSEPLDPMFEINLTTDRMLELLDTSYEGWEIQKRWTKPLAYDIERNGQPVALTTDCITFVAKK
ncbi:class I SAM-dependent methyltransferase [Paenibacillus sp. HB172176]|uniref:class I SAM-dependent methyltransferase n=1 Tax=Paenibacillus sp. HB172176 TaxID=2493690 RepID=UPI00143B934C|nr:class I SAM-dependent methyltransferase [Paenibacillus sp. HB172176]